MQESEDLQYSREREGHKQTARQTVRQGGTGTNRSTFDTCGEDDNCTRDGKHENKHGVPVSWVLRSIRNRTASFSARFRGNLDNQINVAVARATSYVYCNARFELTLPAGFPVDVLHSTGGHNMHLAESACARNPSNDVIGV